MTQAARGALPEQLVTLLTQHMEVRLEPGDLAPTATFKSLGVDSLSLMELVVAAEDEFGIVLPEDTLDLSPASTLADAARVFEEAACAADDAR
ncbi:phosphopantetheine-binding protein [Streptomyces sp. NPDC127190]|uniref:phosphopantetheine-binding protein n=1 Tax=unclassified Streptomyces TaxID=2593676 RepID=UPI00364487A8